MIRKGSIPASLFILVTISTCSFLTAFDDEDLVDSETPVTHATHLPIDKILLKEVKKLVFHRNRRTTSRRTHSIHQLSCVGGTAGCKLFTPNTIECDNVGFNSDKSRFNWRCRADIGENVGFNHVEVLCEGYDYPEDDYILAGSCGLEFTLDYTDPHDHHSNSYFLQMEEHEKELHHRRVKATAKPQPSKLLLGYWTLLDHIVISLSNHWLLLGSFVLLVSCSLILVKLFASSGRTSKPTARASSYGPLTSAVLSTKKAC